MAEFPFSAPLLAAALMACGGPALAQTGPADGSPAFEIRENGGHIAIILRFDGQPRGASVHASGGATLIELDGVSVQASSGVQPDGSVLRRITAHPSPQGGALVWLEGAALSDVSNTIYRNAILIEGRLLDSDNSQPVRPNLKSRVAALAGLDNKRCEQAARSHAADSWDLKALGDHALCRLQAGADDDARAALAQLEAFMPDDWRAALGNAALAMNDRREQAEANLRKAVLSAPSPEARIAIAAYLEGGLQQPAQGHAKAPR